MLNKNVDRESARKVLDIWRESARKVLDIWRESARKVLDNGENLQEKF